MNKVYYKGNLVAEFKLYRQCIKYVFNRILEENLNQDDFSIRGTLKKGN